MESENLLDQYRPALKVIHQVHCPGGSDSMSSSELLKFCSNVRIFPVSPRQDLLSSQDIKQLSFRLIQKTDEAKISYPLFERFLRLLAGQCYSSRNEPSRLKKLMSHIQSACASVYHVTLPKERRYRSSDKTADSSGSSVRNSFAYDFGQLTLAVDPEDPGKERRSECLRGPQTTKTRTNLKMKSMPRLTKKLSLTSGFNKATELRHIYEHPRVLKHTPSAVLDIRHQTSPPATTTARSVRNSEEQAIQPSPRPRAFINPFFSHSRGGSVANEVLNLVKNSLERFKTKIRLIRSSRRVRGLTQRGEAFVKNLHTRRVNVVRDT